MDSERFDALTRFLSSGSSRRRVVAGLASSLIAILPFTIGDDEAEARKKRKKKCKPKCAGKACGKNGCGGMCGRCDGTCIAGVCVCPDGLRNCGGACRQCCDDAHCENGRSCLQGVCACPRGRVPCPNECCQLFETCEIGMCAAPGPPACDGFSSPCTTGATCCSGACLTIQAVMFCARSELGEPCHVDEDCVAGASCVSFHCFFTG